MTGEKGERMVCPRDYPRESRIWRGIRQRCTNPKAAGYHRYGGRGIKVCERWNSFRAFLEDMGPKPSPKHELDRINNDGDYEPGNCRWVTHSENHRNRRNNIIVELNGERMLLVEAQERLGWQPKHAGDNARRGRDGVVFIGRRDSV